MYIIQKMMRKMKILPVKMTLKVREKNIKTFDELIDKGLSISLPSEKIAGILSLEELMKLEFNDKDNLYKIVFITDKPITDSIREKSILISNAWVKVKIEDIEDFNYMYSKNEEIKKIFNFLYEYYMEPDNGFLLVSDNGIGRASAVGAFLEFIYYYKQLTDKEKQKLIISDLIEHFDIYKHWRFYPNEILYYSLVKLFINSH